MKRSIKLDTFSLDELLKLTEFSSSMPCISLSTSSHSPPFFAKYSPINPICSPNPASSLLSLPYSNSLAAKISLNYSHSR